jgi:hypothetical protein
MIHFILLAHVFILINLLNMHAPYNAQMLKLSIQTEKAAYATGEPIWLEISLFNAAASQVRVSKYFMLPADDPNKNNLEIQVYDTAGNRVSRISHTMTGRAIPYPEILGIGPGDTYKDSIRLAGTFLQKKGRKKVEVALWSLGENPQITDANEYPSMLPGTYTVQVSYRVNKKHLISLPETESLAVWQGQLTSNTLQISIK